MKTLFHKLNAFAKQPYPYYYVQDQLPKIGLVVAFLCFVFGYFFEPFVVYRPEHKMDFFWICVVHSVLPACVGYLFFSVLNFFSKKENVWTIGKEVMALAAVLFLIGSGNFLIRDLIYDNPNNWSFGYWQEELLHAFLVGTLLVFVLVPVNFNRLYSRRQREVRSINDVLEDRKHNRKTSGHVFVKTQVKGDDFELDLDGFLFAKAQGNYVELYQRNHGKTVKALKRILLKDLELQLKDYPFLIRTHRAFLINSHKINRITGNALGYEISLADCQEAIPVSRGMLPAFNRLVRSV